MLRALVGGSAPLIPTLVASLAPVLPGEVAAEFPLVEVPGSRSGGDTTWVPVDGLLLELGERSRARWSALALPDGSGVELEVERVELGRAGIAPHVDGRPAPDALDGLALSVWRGRVVGAPDSAVALSFSRRGSFGWIRRGGDLFHLSSRPGPGGDWLAYESSLLSDARALELGGRDAPVCATDRLASATPAPAPPLTPPPPAGAGAGGTLYEASVAVESDHQYFQLFGDAQAALSYMATLLSWVSLLYEEQVGTVLTFPYVNVWTTPGDPWTTPDLPGTCIDMIYELQAAWTGQVPHDASIGHFLSGANLGCGAGFRPGVCVPGDNFSVSGNQTGATPFPPAPNAANIDFYAVCHELGHNFDAIHTHQYCPPVDECAPPGWFGPCQAQQVCVTLGTLMSYCYVCGGFGNVDTQFHPQSADDMRAWVLGSGCLPAHCPEPTTYCDAQVNSDGCLPALSALGSPTLSGDDDFHLRATKVVANKPGMLFYGAAPAAIPFHGGTLCVQAPLARTPPVHSGGAPPPPACTGVLDFHWSQAFMSGHGMDPGSTWYAQFWYRDPAGASGTGLTDAVELTICQ